VDGSSVFPVGGSRHHVSSRRCRAALVPDSRARADLQPRGTRGLFWLIITPALWIGSAGLLGIIVHLISAATAFHRAELQEGRPRPTRLDWRSL
jgi:hypothetical protein